MDISLTDITKSYLENESKRTLFQDLNITFPSGKLSVLMGKSGVGKSTLLNLVSGIDLPDCGTVSVGSECISAMDDDGRTLFRRRHIGFIYQFFNLIPVLTVYDNITLIAELDGSNGKQCRKRADHLLKKVGLFDRRHDYPEKLSGGEQQRVAIVRALVNNPSVILADAPNGNLDKGTRDDILIMILELSRDQVKTLIMVTHSMDAARYADHTFTVENCTLVSTAMNDIDP